MSSNGSPRVATACAAAGRCSPLNASRAASAAARRSAFDVTTVLDMQRIVSPSPHIEVPEGQAVINSTEINRHKSAKPQRPLKHSIPEFPTKVGGHHMSGSTDPARDSSLKDR